MEKINRVIELLREFADRRMNILAEADLLDERECDDPIHVVPPSTATCLCGTLTLPGDFLK